MHKLIIGNWKMNGTLAEAESRARAIADGAKALAKVALVVCPPLPHLDVVAQALGESPALLGAQNCYFAEKGAYTGEVSPSMLVDLGCRYVILGHSERRHQMGETDEVITKKLESACAAGLIPIFCVGETGAERKAGQTEAVLLRQLKSLDGLRGKKLIIAYEPVWAIGTGLVPEVADIVAIHTFIRNNAMNLPQPPILYGGSVTAANAGAILAQSEVDGVLVGGASLEPASFLSIAAAG